MTGQHDPRSEPVADSSHSSQPGPAVENGSSPPANGDGKKQGRGGWLIYVKVLISAGVLFFFFRTIDYGRLSGIMDRIDILYMFPILAIILLRHVLGAVRFRMLIPFKEGATTGILLKHYFIASFFNNFLPTALGGDGVRVFLMKECGIAKSEGTLFILVERLIGFFSYILIAFFTTFGLRMPLELRLVIWGITAGYTCALFIIFYFGWKVKADKIRFGILRRVVSAFRMFQSYKPALVKVFLLSFLFQLSAIYTSYLVSSAFGMGIPFLFFPAVLPLIGLAVMVPISLGGVGLREMAFVYFFSIFGIATENSLVISLGTYVTLLAGGLFGAAVFFYDKIVLKVTYQVSKEGGRPHGKRERID